MGGRKEPGSKEEIKESRVTITEHKGNGAGGGAKPRRVSRAPVRTLISLQVQKEATEKL